MLRNFEYYTKARKLADNDRLLSIIERITDPRINLTDKNTIDPDGLPLPALTNVGMGTVFEELLRRFNEENNEEAGEHFTPRDAISLLAHLVFEPVKENLPKIITLYDPACGSGGMLTESREYLLDLGVRSAAIQLSVTESGSNSLSETFTFRSVKQPRKTFYFPVTWNFPKPLYTTILVFTISFHHYICLNSDLIKPLTLFIQSNNIPFILFK